MAGTFSLLSRLTFGQACGTASVVSRGVNRRSPELWKARRIKVPSLPVPPAVSEAATAHHLESIPRHMETCYWRAKVISIESVS
jgi:hypothetical protein